MENKVSALLILYNEEKRIENCLKSIQWIADEIIVIHDGLCLDKTLDICKKFKCKIFIREHIGEPKPHTPFGLKKCSNEWILLIDADERLSPKLNKNIRKLIEMKADAYSFKWVAEINGKKSNFLTKQVLFRKSKMYSIGLPHVQCETRGLLSKSELVLVHESSEFNSKYKLLKMYLNKDKKWGKVTAMMLQSKLSDVPVYNCNLNDSNLKQIQKIKLIKEFPFFAMLIVPVYSLVYGFIINQGFRQGLLGLILATHVPLHAFFTCYYLSLLKLKAL